MKSLIFRINLLVFTFILINMLSALMLPWEPSIVAFLFEVLGIFTIAFIITVDVLTTKFPTGEDYGYSCPYT